MIDRKAQAEWKGGLRDGSGQIRAGGLESSYSFASRFGDGEGTTPEALIGAAHAGCFSMAFSLMLSEEGYKPESIRTTATVRLDPDELRITEIALETEGVVDGLDDAGEFERIANKAKENCPVSKALAATDIRLASARLADG